MATGYWTVAINSDFCSGCAIVVVVVVLLLLMMRRRRRIFLPLVPKPVSLKNKI